MNPTRRIQPVARTALLAAVVAGTATTACGNADESRRSEADAAVGAQHEAAAVDAKAAEAAQSGS